MKYDANTIAQWIRELETPSKELTSWESQFLESITDQWDRYHRLSDKQIEILEKIYAEKTN